MIIEILKLFILCTLIAFWCNGLFLIVQAKNEYALAFIDRWASLKIQCSNPMERRRFLFWYNPLIGCITCMASVWGTVFYFIYCGHSLGLDSIYELPLTIIISAFLNTLLYKHAKL